MGKSLTIKFTTYPEQTIPITYAIYLTILGIIRSRFLAYSSAAKRLYKLPKTTSNMLNILINTNIYSFISSKVKKAL